MKRTQAYKCAHKCNKKLWKPMKTYENIWKTDENVQKWTKTYETGEKRTTREKNVHKRIKTDRNVRKYTKICEGEKFKKIIIIKKLTKKKKNA